MWVGVSEWSDNNVFLSLDQPQLQKTTAPDKLVIIIVKEMVKSLNQCVSFIVENYSKQC